MFILRAIGSFFVKIGRWIKNTAWVQPLLIVGGIFAIIFSIPYITSWVGSWFTSGSAAQSFYRSHEISLEGAEDRKSDVDKLFDYLANPTSQENAAARNKYGEKFFLAIVQENCSNCEDRYGAYKTLQSNWKTGEFSNVTGEFKLYTIYADTHNDDGDSLFKKVCDRSDVQAMFERANEVLQDQNRHPYAVNNNAGASEYTSSLAQLIEEDEMRTPTTFLIDLTAVNENNIKPNWVTENGIREILFNFESTSGSDDYAKARTLRNAWTNDWLLNKDEGRNNIFSTYYKKA